MKGIPKYTTMILESKDHKTHNRLTSSGWKQEKKKLIKEIGVKQLREEFAFLEENYKETQKRKGINTVREIWKEINEVTEHEIDMVELILGKSYVKTEELLKEQSKGNILINIKRKIEKNKKRQQETFLERLKESIRKQKEIERQRLKLQQIIEKMEKKNIFNLRKKLKKEENYEKQNTSISTQEESDGEEIETQIQKEALIQEFSQT